jgi:hypothetical protein
VRCGPEWSNLRLLSSAVPPRFPRTFFCSSVRITTASRLPTSATLRIFRGISVSSRERFRLDTRLPWVHRVGLLECAGWRVAFSPAVRCGGIYGRTDRRRYGSRFARESAPRT